MRSLVSVPCGTLLESRSVHRILYLSFLVGFSGTPDKCQVGACNQTTAAFLQVLSNS
jgi:hypothetical protein